VKINPCKTKKRAELFIDSKKDLQIEESPLFKSLKYLNFSYGTLEGFDVRTYKEYLKKINLRMLIELNNQS